MGRSERAKTSMQDQLWPQRGDPGETRQEDLRMPLLLRPGEAAAALGVGRTTVYELMRSGALRAVHIGRAVRIPMRAIIDFVDRQTGL